MSTSRGRTTRKPASARRRETVGGSESGGWNAVFVGSIVAVVLSLVVLVTVAADSFTGGGGDDQQAAPDPTETETPGSAGTAPPTNPAGGSATPPTITPTPGADGAIVVACGDILAPVDKQHRLPRDCAPNDLKPVPGGPMLRAEAAAALVEMFTAASQAGYTLYVNSGYRSYDEQAATYQYWVSVSGREYADRTSARAGHSEHQLGTTADIAARGLELENFTGTPEAAWLAANSYKFGFIISYPDGKDHITGYAYEPWHVRYVGKDVAQKVKDSGLTLHEYLLR